MTVKASIRYDVIQLSNDFKVNIQNHFQSLLENLSGEETLELWSAIKCKINDVAKNSLNPRKVRHSPWISDEALWIAEEQRAIKTQGLVTEEKTDTVYIWIYLGNFRGR